MIIVSYHGHVNRKAMLVLIDAYIRYTLMLHLEKRETLKYTKENEF